MAAPGKQSGSLWGSFLSSAVTSVESRLDNMLTEGEENERERQQAASANKAASTNKAPPPAQKPTSASKPNRANDRLQARLAKAVAARNAQPSSSPRNSIDQPSPASSVRASMDKDSRPGNETPSAKDTSELNGSKSATPDPATESKSTKPSSETPPSSSPAPDTPVSAKDATVVKKEPPKESMDALPSQSVAPAPTKKDNDTEVVTEAKVVLQAEPDLKDEEKKEVAPEVDSEPSTQDEVKKIEDISKQSIENNDPKNQEPEKLSQTPNPPTEPSSETSQTNEELETIKARQQEEIQEYVERIDALQSKLQYLSKNAVETSKKNKTAAPKGSMEQKLAEKDEKIALLMQEGQKLSATEGKFRTTIRKLRAQIADNEKQIDALKKSKESAIAEVEDMRNNVNSNEEQEKKNEEIRNVSATLQKEIDALKKEIAVKDEGYRRLEQDTKVKAEQAEFASTEAMNKAVAAEREKQKNLEEIIANLRTENETLSNKVRLDGVEWQEKLDRAAERNRSVEDELKLELRAAESKLEAMRAAAEEASSGAGGDSQIKLIRQIETLQSQYASASDNWQGIEASLLAKVSNMEKERDDAQRRESEMRKKARDSAARCRRLEDDLQDLTPALATARQELETCREELAKVRTQSKSTETALEQAKVDLEKQQRSSSFAAEADRRQWADEMGGSTSRNQSRPESPMLSVPRTFSSDFGLPVPGRPPRRAATPGSNPDSVPEGMFFARRLSNNPPVRTTTLSTLGSGILPAPLSPFESQIESPRAISPPPDRDDDADSSAPRNVAQDMISVSTVGAGPSVQLVERMSAAIRRLEAEKVAAKEEMSRVCSQRDEARSDIVGLMKDLESNKSAATKVSELEAEMETMNQRYQTTLELLGEKSELVEELRADVQDVKAMYRDLVERTIK